MTSFPRVALRFTRGYILWPPLGAEEVRLRITSSITGRLGPLGFSVSGG
jgi:hypothetical protein